jgi:hypothetical protein
MERLTKEQAFQLHHEFENVDDFSMETYSDEDGIYGSEGNYRDGRSD